MIHIDIKIIPKKRKLTALKKRADAVISFAASDEKRNYVRTTSGWGLLKEWLSEHSSGKCWYCDARTNRAPLDVDHFRPKLAVTVARNILANHPGYYWLAYDWKNFRLSCQRCNKHETDNKALFGKQNEFALVDETLRNSSPEETNAESPLLLDPCIKEDTDLLVHLLSGEVHPAETNKSSESFRRAKYTIKTLGLNEHGTPTERRQLWGTLSLLIKSQENPPSQEVQDNVSNYLQRSQHYSSFFRAAIGTYKTENWIANLL